MLGKKELGEDETEGRKGPEGNKPQTYLANPGGFTYNDVVFCVNVWRIVINIQDLYCDWNITDKAGII